MNKLSFKQEAKQKLLKGINQLNDAVVTTLGPGGRNVIYADDYGSVLSTKDGVTVAKMIKQLEDPIENIGMNMLKQASIKTGNEAGDGTTTSTLLATELVNEGFKVITQGVNPVEIKKGMELALHDTLEYLKSISKDISSQEQLKQIATISANGDEEVGKIISTAMEGVGMEGVVTIEESKTGETYLETVEGMQFDRGYKSPYFVTDNNNMSCVLNEPFILIYDKRLTQIKELLPVLDYVSKQDKSLLIIAEDVDNEALATLIVNKMRGILKIVAVKAPDFGDRRAAMLQDLATVTGGSVISPDKGMRLDKFESEWLGKSQTVTVTKDTTTIVDGKGTEEAIEKRIEEIKQQLDKSTSPYETEKLQERLAKLVGGVAVVYVGAHTEIEMKEKKDRVDDALHATKAALSEGILPGGGVALLRASEKVLDSKEYSSNVNLGYHIVMNALKQPFLRILQNVGIDTPYRQASKVLEQTDWVGYNVKSNTYGDMLTFGILDPTKVTKSALSNAVSIASTVLLTDCVVFTKVEKTKPATEEAEQY